MAVWNAYGRYVCGEPYWSTIERSCILAFSRILGAHFYVSFPHRFLPEYLDRGLTLFMDRVASPLQPTLPFCKQTRAPPEARKNCTTNE